MDEVDATGKLVDYSRVLFDKAGLKEGDSHLRVEVRAEHICFLHCDERHISRTKFKDKLKSVMFECDLSKCAWPGRIVLERGFKLYHYQGPWHSGFFSLSESTRQGATNYMDVVERDLTLANCAFLYTLDDGRHPEFHDTSPELAVACLAASGVKHTFPGTVPRGETPNSFWKLQFATGKPSPQGQTFLQGMQRFGFDGWVGADEKGVLEVVLCKCYGEVNGSPGWLECLRSEEANK